MTALTQTLTTEIIPNAPAERPSQIEAELESGMTLVPQASVASPHSVPQQAASNATNAQTIAEAPQAVVGDSGRSRRDVHFSSESPEHCSPFPSVIFYLGEDIGAFYRSFAHIGSIYQRLEPEMFGE